MIYNKILGGYDVLYENGVKMGEILIDVDGYHYFWPNRDGAGLWPSCHMRSIADKLDALNAPWDQQIKDFFDGKPNTPLPPIGF